MPKISIVIPAYNSEKFIDRTINSVLNQTYKDWELLIIDDGSTDNTKSIIDKYSQSNPHIKYFYQENGGQGSARNLGVKVAAGNWVAFLDHDDIWLPKKLDIQVAELDKSKNAIGCTCGAAFFNENSKKIIKIEWFNLISGSIFRRDVLLNVGLFDDDKMLIGLDDAAIALKLQAYSFKTQEIFLTIPQILVFYCISSGQLMKQKLKILNSMIVFVQKYSVIFSDNAFFANTYKGIGSLSAQTHNIVDAKRYFKLSLRVKFNFEVLILLFSLYLNYRLTIMILDLGKFLRDGVFWKIKLLLLYKKVNLNIYNFPGAIVK